MLKIWQWLFGRSLTSALSETKTVRVGGVRFVIRKVSTLDFLEGSKVLLQVHDLYAVGKPSAQPEMSTSKIRAHFGEVLVAGVVSPKLCFKPDGDGMYIERLFVDWPLVETLYSEIMSLSYGKKKLSSLPAKKSNTSTRSQNATA